MNRACADHLVDLHVGSPAECMVCRAQAKHAAEVDRLKKALRLCRGALNLGRRSPSYLKARNTADELLGGES